MKTINKPIIELVRDDMIDYDYEYMDIKFLGESIPNIYEVFSIMNSIYTNIGESERSRQQLLDNLLSDTEKTTLFNELKNEWDFEDYSNFKELMKDYEYEVFEYLFHNDNQATVALIESNGLQIDTAGYSNWSYYIAAGDVSRDYISDLYDGYNFYVVSLAEVDDDNVLMDLKESIGFVYLLNESDLENFVRDHFDIDDFLLINNEASEYFSHAKVKQVEHVTKEFKIIEGTE